MAKKKKNRIETSGQTASLGTFGSLFQAAGFEAPQPHNTSATNASTSEKECPPPSAVGWELLLAEQTGLLVRVERKGRKGKTVTIVSRLKLEKSDLADVARALSKALGCGSSIEILPSDNNIVVQGDNLDRVVKWLNQHGAKLKNQ